MLLKLFLLATFLFPLVFFGFVFLNKINKITSLIPLSAFSIPLGASFYIFICHIFSLGIGPKKASILTLILLIIFSILIVILKGKVEINKEEISKRQKYILFGLSSIIAICTLLSVYRFGIFDEIWHIPLTLSIFHNDTYPPKDFLRPDYNLLYHFGGNLLGGAISYITLIEIYNSFHLISAISSFCSFLSFFALGWVVTKSYTISLICAICCYFGSGLPWVNALLDFFSNNSESLLKTILNNGLRTSFTDPQHIANFTSKAIATPIAILCFFLLYRLFNYVKESNSFKVFYTTILTLIILLFSLTTIAGWFVLSISIGLCTLLIISPLVERKKFTHLALNILILLALFYIVNKLIGIRLYSEEEYLGRVNVFDLGLRNPLFSIKVWSGAAVGQEQARILSCFSPEFFLNFGFSLILLPIAIIYLIKEKNSFSFLLFLSSILIIPIPLIFDFKMNPVDFNRLIPFGNTMLIFLITCGVGSLFKNFFKNKFISFVYIMCFSLSSLAAFILGTIFPPQIYFDRNFTDYSIREFKKARSPVNLLKTYYKINKKVIAKKYEFQNKHKHEIDFYLKNTKPKDVVISSAVNIPLFAGVYTLVPTGYYGLKEQIYSKFDNIYTTIISTLDPYLLKELNVKWVGYDEISKSKLSKEVLSFLNNKDFFKLKYKNIIKLNPKTKAKFKKEKVLYEIYKVNNLEKAIKLTPRQTGWILLNRNGFPLEITKKLNENIKVYKTEKKALQYLKHLTVKNPEIKKEFIIAQPVVIKVVEEQLKQANLNTMLEKTF